MTHTETITILRQFNEWRRLEDDALIYSDSEVGEAIDAAVEMIDRLEAAESDGLEQARLLGMSGEREAALLSKLEAAEKERDGLHHCFNEWIDKTEWVQRGINEGTISPKYIGLHRADVIASLLGEAEKERDALRAKIEAMEQQEPVAWLHETRRDSVVVTSAVKHVWQRARPMSLAAYPIPLYLAPGAKGE